MIVLEYKTSPFEGTNVRNGLLVVTFFCVLAGCATTPPRQNFFVLFFVPGTVRLAPEAEQIVRQAAATALMAKVSKIEIAVAQDTPGGVPLREGRATAIQNILSASHVDSKLYARANMPPAAASVAGAADRAEITLVP